MRRHVRNRRNSIGSFIAENAGVMVAVFLGFIFPFVNLATIGLRYAILLRAVHDTTHMAAGATSFSSGSSSYAVMDYVPTQLNNSLSQTSGIVVVSKSVCILVTPFSTNVVSAKPANTPLPAVPTPDPTANIYAIQVTVNANVKPLVEANLSFLPAIPGISGPMAFSVSSQEIAENPSGLSQ